MSFHIIHFSKNLRGYADVNLYLPVGTEYEDMLEPGEKFQTLWLLHGHSGSFMEWPQYSSVEKLAMLNGFAVVSVDGANSLYNDLPNGDNYYTYITEELPAFLRKHFPLSDSREDNFIAGLSMGGLGAAKIGFVNPDKYGAVGIFSCGPADPLVKPLTSPEEKPLIFKPDDLEPGKPNDIWGNFLRLKESGYPMPVIYDADGEQDFTMEWFLKFSDFVREQGMDEYVKIESWPGVHDWTFWDEALRRFTDLLPLKNRGIWRTWYNGRHPEAR